MPFAAEPSAAGPFAADPASVRFRAAAPQDATAVAALHADSWRRHYRGAFSDAFLDERADELLRARWGGRLARPGPGDRTILAEAGGALAGFAHVAVGDNAAWGALLDNLHVAYGLKRSGIGTRLMAQAAQAVLTAAPSSGLYLWVLERNEAARAFYAALGGECVERAPDDPPDGDPASLVGTVTILRIHWKDPGLLLRSRPLPVAPDRTLSPAGTACQQDAQPFPAP